MGLKISQLSVDTPLATDLYEHEEAVGGLSKHSVLNAQVRAGAAGQSQADGAAAVGLVINNTVSLVTAGAKIISFENAGVEKGFVDKDGDLSVEGNFGVNSVAPVAQPAKIADPTAGATIDAEARTAIDLIIDALEGVGITASV